LNAHSPQAYFLSAILHAVVVVLVLFVGFTASQNRPETTKVFELVAGSGDNYAATVAPAIGVPGGIKVTVPEAPAAPVPPAPEPAAIPPPQSVPMTEAPPVPVAKPAPTKNAPSKTEQVPNFTKTVQRTENRKAARIEANYRKQLEKEAAAEKKRESYEQYLKENGGKAGTSAKSPRVNAEGIAGGVVGGSTANKEGGAGGKALTRDQQDLFDSYFAMLKARLKENHVPPPGVSDRLEARVEFYLSASGTISSVRILRSSGNSDFDESVLDAFRHTSMPPRPDHRGETNTLTFKMRDEDSE
jgi:colicin import membrane protein